MNINAKLIVALCVIGLTIPGTSLIADEQVYGWQLMSEQERNEYRTKIQNMNTKKEQERYRLEHHRKMEQRAKQQGVTLPSAPKDRSLQMEGSGNRGQGGGRGR